MERAEQDRIGEEGKGERKEKERNRETRQELHFPHLLLTALFPSHLSGFLTQVHAEGGTCSDVNTKVTSQEKNRAKEKEGREKQKAQEEKVPR